MNSLAQNLWLVALVAVPIIIAITLHEAAHGFVARHFGDSTAADLGRVTLNPLRHVDLFGTILLPALLLLSHTGIIFGYAKPVPVNFAALNNPKRDMIWVAAACIGVTGIICGTILLFRREVAVQWKDFDFRKRTEFLRGLANLAEPRQEDEHIAVGFNQ